jgi:two-component system chemotaxis response regulator CheB
VVVAEDSEIALAVLEGILEADPSIRVVGRARNGEELLALKTRNIAQVVIVDVLMPQMGGLSVLRKLAHECPVIAVSSVERDSAVAREALALGAVAFFSKRDLTGEHGAERFRTAVKQAHKPSERAPHLSVLFIIGSTGAIGPLETLAQGLVGVAAPIVVLQHLPEGKEHDLARLLSFRGLTTRVAAAGDLLAPGAFVAPSGRHIRLDPYDRFQLDSTPPISGHRPSADPLLRSAIRLGSRAIAIVLSGLGNDGSQSVAALAEHGGTCYAQHPREAQAPSMPSAALSASPCVRPVRIADLSRNLRRMLGG